MPLAAYFSMILTELRRWQHNYDCKKFYNIGHRPARILEDASEHDGGAATDGDPADQDLLLRRRRRQNPQQPGLAVPVGQRPGGGVVKLFFVVTDKEAELARGVVLG
jgi:hypothetical protein